MGRPLELGFDPAQRVDLQTGKILSLGLADVEKQPNELTVGATIDRSSGISVC